MRARLTSLALLFALTFAAVASAQTRTPPSGTDPRLFVEVAEPGALGFQVVALKATTIVGDHAVLPDDLLFYHTATGWTFIVRNRTHPFGMGSLLLPYAPLSECFQQTTLRPGLTLIPAALDRDNRGDLLGYDPKLGTVVRLYQRGTAYACTY